MQVSVWQKLRNTEKKLNYIGSKRKLAANIFNEISSRVSSGTFCDLFAGTGAVSEKFTEYSLLVNDWEDYGYCINYQKFEQYIPDNLNEKIDHLNNVEPFFGFIAEHYSPNKDSDRMYFTDYNAEKIDAIRCEIEEISSCKEEQIYLTALLLHATDAVANTASVYGAYLKKFKDSAKKSLKIEDKQKFSNTGKVFCEDANLLNLKIEGDILYLDPPYNTRHYGANYHILNTIVNYEDFTPKGVTGLPEYKKSAYCSKVKIKEAFNTLIRDTKFKHLFISYNDEGILTPNDFEEICTNYGKLEQITLDSSYQRFKADSSRVQKQENTIEYLYYVQILEKNSS